MGGTVLTTAIFDFDSENKDDIQKFSTLLNLGADPNVETRCFIGGKTRIVTPIVVAASEGSYDLVRLLIDHGASTIRWGEMAINITKNEDIKDLIFSAMKNYRIA